MKITLYSPLLGAFFAFIVLMLYGVSVSVFVEKIAIGRVLLSALYILPFLFFLFYIISLISYGMVLSILFWLHKKIIITDGWTWFIGFLFGTILGWTYIYFNHIDFMTLKAFAFWFAWSFGLMFNMSMRTVLIRNKNNLL